MIGKRFTPHFFYAECKISYVFPCVKITISNDQFFISKSDVRCFFNKLAKRINKKPYREYTNNSNNADSYNGKLPIKNIDKKEYCYD